MSWQGDGPRLVFERQFGEWEGRLSVRFFDFSGPGNRPGASGRIFGAHSERERAGGSGSGAGTGLVGAERGGPLVPLYRCNAGTLSQSSIFMPVAGVPEGSRWGLLAHFADK